MIIKFHTQGCAPCKAVSEILNAGGVIYEEVDIGLDIDSAIEYRVQAVPTLLNTETGDRLVGFKDKITVEGWINDNYS
jgi:glutaredoxin|tara:strand:+ start:2612 stop:2845 length:234 start_codon:yes stop_codon:yes gene_type:complete